MAEMSKKEIRKFLIQSTLTGRIGTVKKDASPHVVPVWFMLNKEKKQGGGKARRYVFMMRNGFA